MITSRGTDSLSAVPEAGAVVSIGVFDGVHLGHRAILAANVERAAGLCARSTVVTFTGHPKAVLLGRAPRTLTPLDHRLELFARAGIAHTLVLEFDEALREVGAEAFVEEVLVARLGAVAFVLGFDSKFGRDRGGTPARLRELGHAVEVVPKVVVDDRAVSSTAIREAVELGDLEGASRMLGRRVSAFGRVVRGAELGRELGFPTANLDLDHQLHPPPGVYACFAHLPQAAEPAPNPLPAACNIGFRPTVDERAPSEPVVEVHLLDLERDLYGERIELEFVERLRAERRFADLDALRAQIGRDVERAREVLERA
ncbi:MAG: riboflavin biosynthesis protein RibF [Planctomycetota bacterium]|jgi:riboflavin kinase/FMN adenylyltransferase|nr:riboflavin biosynthesis protein RibF [Planctomycetota bacterium]MDP6763028.1 riboflavin biosynthesis protein RibF [Planctomycetota bacterium]MDP6988199.1 riboflavin biosynthesis protein RibF [Planctomycetota bacterium]